MKVMAFSAVLLAGIVLFAGTAIAVERHVPSEYSTIQAAINACNTDDIVIVAPGTYYENVVIPSKGITLTSEDPDNSNTVASTIINGGQSGSVININGCCVTITIAGLTITNGLASAGGGIRYSGSGGINLFVRNCRITNNRTANGADATQYTPGQPGGNGAGIYCGGAVYLNLTGCVITANTCGRGGYGAIGTSWTQPGGNGGKGGGIYCYSSTVEINDSQINTNLSGNGGSAPSMPGYGPNPGNGGNGGGIYGEESPLDINNCAFQQNTAGSGGGSRFIGGNGGKGGAICSTSSSAGIRNSQFIANTSGYGGGCAFCDPATYPGGDGGGIYSTGSTVIENCLVVQNVAGGSYANFSKSGNGGGIYCTSTSIENCTIANNTIGSSPLGGYGGGIYAGSGGSVQNSIIWGNNAQANPQIYGSPSVGYSDVQGGFGGLHNINADPLFVSGPGGNYYLSQRAAGQTSNSPCVSSGSDTAINLGMNSKTTRTDEIGDSGIADIGYHYPATISVGSPDLNGDELVDFIDYAIFAGDWKSSPDPCDPNNGDIIKNGQVDIYDLAVLVESWLTGSSIVPIDPNLVSRWKFDEGSGTIVHDSAGNNNGTIYGATWTTGRINGALNFDGSDDYVEIPDNDNSLDIDNEITIAAWVKINSDWGEFCIVGKQPSGTASAYSTGNYQLFLLDVFLIFGHQTGTGEGQEMWYDTLEDPDPITPYVWQHVAVTLKEGYTVEFYINGNPVKSWPQTDPFGIVNDEPVRIGIVKNGGLPFYGLIDDVQIYNRALTSGEIELLYLRGELLPPEQASNPSPANWATGVIIPTDISWTAGSFATSHDVYFGTMNPPPFVINQTGTTYDTGTMDANTVYYWRINEKNSIGTTKGDVWSFTTILPPLPGQASNPAPTDGATVVKITTDLSWTAGSFATSHDVYFGTVNPAPFKVNQTGTTYDTGTMITNTVYYWRIDEKNISGTTTGAVWSFTTSPVSDSSHVAWWQFDEGSGTLAGDSTGNGHTGTFTFPTWINDPYRGWCLGFNDNGLVTVASSDALNITGDITISAWVYLEDTSSIQGIVAKNAYNNRNCPFDFRLEGTSLELIRSGPGNPEGVYSTSPLSTQKWYHVAVRVENRVPDFYIDGIITGKTIEHFISTVGGNTYPLYIGGSYQGFYFNGKIDSVRIYNRALSEEEIEQIYHEERSKKASYPIPANGEVNVNLTQDLSWTAGEGATSHDVYFGTVNPPPFVINQTGTTYDTGTMNANTTYYWRIDEQNAGGTTTGDIWSFTTVPPPPGQASNPTPEDMATDVEVSQNLSWTAGSYATSHDVYFGTINPPPFQGNQAGTIFDTGTMDVNTTYYWQIDEKNGSGTTIGILWTFTTGSGEVNDINFVSWWKFDEGTGTVAYDSAGSNDGQLMNGPVWTPGQIDGGLSFDGTNDYVDVPDDASLRFRQNDRFSICCWAKPTGGTNHYESIFSKYRTGGTHNVFGYMLFWSADTLSFGFAAEKSFVGATITDTLGGTAPAGEWYFVAGVYDNKNMKIYLDGQPAGNNTFAYDTGDTVPNHNATIGARGVDSTFDCYFTGEIDDVRIYNRALTAEEVALLYQQGQ